MHRILVVDDQPANCLPLARLFNRNGLHATSAGSGEEALAVLEVFAPHLILLDLMMPELDGFAVLRLIRAEVRHDRIKVLMYTAVAHIEVRVEATRLGAQGYIVKGTSFADLHAEVRRHLADVPLN